LCFEIEAAVKMQMTRLILIAIAFALASGPVFAKSVRFFCDYPSFASPDGVEKVTKKFSLEFAVDTISGTAVMIGSIGVENVAVHAGVHAITFMERIGTGIVQTTTVNMRNGETIHSRHSLIGEGAKFVPTQYYGKCLIR